MNDQEYIAKAEKFYKYLKTIESIYLERQKNLNLHSLDNLYAHVEQLGKVVEILDGAGSEFYDSEIEKTKQITNSFLEKVCEEIGSRF